ncbi:MAG: hypothetical protein F4W92_05660 [Gammaproteobacteria bacterium]|nr:hypothetical protein [Gammaproteobacteria bacterium]
MSIYDSEIWHLLSERIDVHVKQLLVEQPRCMPNEETFRQLVEVAFDASLLSEEKRQPKFRIIFCSPNELADTYENIYFNRSIRLIQLDTGRTFEASELNRIAPAADLTRSLICVYFDEDKNFLQIWGLLDMGKNWWQFIQHETEGGTPPPNFLCIASTRPGELSFSLQGDILFSVNKGIMSPPSSDNPIWVGPISIFLAASRKSLYKQVLKELGTEKWYEGDDDYPLRYYNFFLERILYNVRNSAHGGTIIIVPEEFEFDDPRLTDRVRLKYTTKFDCAWDCLFRSLVNESRYYDLHSSLCDDEQECNTDVFKQYVRLATEKEHLDEELQDIAKCMAALTNVDGAVVMTTRFNVLGFSGEIKDVSPTLCNVVDALRPRREIPIETFGTRHRSAFRFCSNLEDSVAFIVSADGGVKAAKREGRDVLLWPDINRGAMGL